MRFANQTRTVHCMDTHRRLPVWQLAARLVDEVYCLTEALPPREQFVVTPQLRRAAWSVLNNIAEGNAKLGRREMRRFFDIALGSLAEVDSMVAKLTGLYRLDSSTVQTVMELRRKVNAGLFALLRSDGR
jgi:four helix bundle protein